MREKKDLFCSADLLCRPVPAVPGCSYYMLPKLKIISENCCAAYCLENETGALNYQQHVLNVFIKYEEH